MFLSSFNLLFETETQALLAEGHKKHLAKPSFHPFTSSSFHLFSLSPFHPSSYFHPFYFFTFSPFLEPITQLHPHFRIARIHGKHARIGMKIVVASGKTNLVVKVVLTRKAIEHASMRHIYVGKGRKG